MLGIRVAYILSLVTLGLNREMVASRPFRMNERLGTHCSSPLGISGHRAFREQNTKSRITDGWRWKFQSRFAILISCSPWCGLLSFFSLLVLHFLTRGNAVCREHECEMKTFRRDVGCRSRRGEPPRKFSPDLRERGEVKIVQNQCPRARGGRRNVFSQPRPAPGNVE